MDLKCAVEVMEITLPDILAVREGWMRFRRVEVVLEVVSGD